MNVVLDNLDLFLKGTQQTVTLTVLSFAFAFVVGIVMAGFRVSPVPPLRALGTVYVTIIRNTPVAVLMYLFFFGSPKVGILFSGFTSAIIVLSAYTGTFVTETVRAGVNSVAVGQAEAARALGMSFPQVFGVIILPQALRTVVQPLGSIFSALIRNSAVATVIGVSNLTKTVVDVSVLNASYAPVYLGAAVTYLLLTIPTGQAVGWIERRVAIKR